MALMDDQLHVNRIQPAYIRFKNTTKFHVEINWIDKIEKQFGVLPPNQFLDVNTYSSHPWVFRLVNTYGSYLNFYLFYIFRERLSKAKMLVCGEKTFLAKAWVDEHKRLGFEHPINIPLRTLVSIEMPVLDLRLLSLICIADRLKNEEDVTLLEIPKSLENELSEMVSNKRHK